MITGPLRILAWANVSFDTARAALGAYRVGRSCSYMLLNVYSTSLIHRQAKIALKVKTEDEMLELEAIAKSLNLCARSIQDAYVPVPGGSCFVQLTLLF